MKQSKITILLITLIIFLLLTGCNNTHQYELKQEIENIAGVTIVDEQGEFALTKAEYEELLTELQELPCKKYWNDPCQTIGEPYILIEYVDGNCEAICSSASSYNNGKSIKYGIIYFDYEDFQKLLQGISDH